VLINNPNLDHPVKLDLRLVEADQVTTPATAIKRPDVVDGIELDNIGSPRAYHLLQEHPGAYGIGPDLVTSRRIPAAAMIHWYRADRPGQHRGVPEITPALPLFAQLRRYTLAVLGAAETAADFAAVLYTDAPASGEATPVEPLDVIELEKRMATTLPDGWKLGQIKAEQPLKLLVPAFQQQRHQPAAPGTEESRPAERFAVHLAEIARLKIRHRVKPPRSHENRRTATMHSVVVVVARRGFTRFRPGARIAEVGSDWPQPNPPNVWVIPRNATYCPIRT